MNTTLKRLAAEVLWHAASRSFVARRRLRPLGLRIKHAWLGSRTGSVQLANGKTALLAEVGNSYLAFELHWKGWEYFSPYAVLTLQALLRDSSAFVDVGANIGYYSLFAASEREDIALVAFEPNTRNFGILRANSALNGARIRCVHAAVSDTTGRQVLHVPPSQLSGSLEAAFNPAVERTEQVQTYRLDDYFAQHPLPGRPVLKAIVEGHEPSLLRGATGLLDAHRPDMILAVSRRYDDETVALLRRRGYAFYQITDGGLRPEERPVPCRVDRWFFLEHLVTTRSADEVRGLSAGLRPRFASLVLADTNTNRPDLIGRDEVW